jgi:hypothetical protein
VAALLESGAGVDALDKFGKTPLMKAAESVKEVRTPSPSTAPCSFTLNAAQSAPCLNSAHSAPY